MKKLLFFILITFQFASGQNKEEINLVLNNWHKAAADANFTNYFKVLTDDAIYIGTDASENWNKKQFEAFAKPYFDKGKAWNFKALQRNIYFSKDGKMAWFDELLNTQMKICRGSGVMIKEKDTWKIKHYVLSMTIPNENTDQVIQIKTATENLLIQKLESK